MLVEVDHLTKTFRNFTAVNDVSFSIREGEILGLLGPNGAGKSTIIHTLLGLIAPTAGEIRIFGMPLSTHRAEILQQLNFTSPYVSFPPRLTVYENLNVFALMYGVPDRPAKIAELLRKFSIERLSGKPVTRLSSGEGVCVGLCKAFLNDPKLLLLDEPTAHLDPRAARRVKEVLLDLRDRCGTTILYTSHNMAEAERMCERIVFLDRGRVIAAGSPIEVTHAILREERATPALEEVFIRVGEGDGDAAA
ncbi:MAG TPA: ABC transporter ATP-binding protein [Candidatus Binataceae bacterium]|nr:ABC transporter ATP-binding protein [Candidatus Binataceae bacterium]